MKEVLRAKLEKSAKARGDSINSEIVQRLEQSYVDEQYLGGPHTQAFAKLLGVVLHGTELETGKKWSEDIATQRTAFLRIIEILKQPALPISQEEWEQRCQEAIDEKMGLPPTRKGAPKS